VKLSVVHHYATEYAIKDLGDNENQWQLECTLLFDFHTKLKLNAKFFFITNFICERSTIGNRGDRAY